MSAQYLVLDENEDYVYDQDFESALSAQGFPESYKYYLRQLHAAHPQWVFKAHSTGLSWTDVINKETANVSTNLVHKSQPDSWKSTEPGAVDSDGNYVEFDSGGYVAASRGIVEYYMDPRNFLNEAAYSSSWLILMIRRRRQNQDFRNLWRGLFSATSSPRPVMIHIF